MKLNGKRLKRYWKIGKERYKIVKKGYYKHKMPQKAQRISGNIQSYFRESTRQIRTFKPIEF